MKISHVKFQLAWLLLTGCVAITPDRVELPAGKTVAREQLIINSDFNLPRQHRLVDELVAQRGDLAAKLHLPVSDEPIYVYLFDASPKFHRYVHAHFPDLPERRAFFVETDTKLTVLAHWGDNVADDLRHEVAHGYLHSVVPNLPLWLDEGLAEYFEVPRGHGGLNRPHVELLWKQYSEGTWRPLLPRLERLVSIDEMSQREYAESWAWVHWLLETHPERLAMFRGYLAQLRTTGKPELLSPAILRLDPSAEQSLIEHLGRLAATRPL